MQSFCGNRAGFNRRQALRGNTPDMIIKRLVRILQVSAALARVQPGWDNAQEMAQMPVAAPDAELVWQADRLQRQVNALQEEREALAQHLDHMQEALMAAKEKGASLLSLCRASTAHQHSK